VYRCTPDLQKTAECCPRHTSPVMDRIGFQLPTRLCMCRSVYQRLSSLPCTICFQGRFSLVPGRPETRLGMFASGVAYRQVIRNVDLSHRNEKVMGKTHVYIATHLCKSAVGDKIPDEASQGPKIYLPTVRRVCRSDSPMKTFGDNSCRSPISSNEVVKAAVHPSCRAFERCGCSQTPPS